MENDDKSKSELKTKIAIAIGKRIQEQREKKGYSMVEFSNVMDSTRQSIFKLENGEYMPTIPALYRISKILSCDISEFLPSSEEF